MLRRNGTLVLTFLAPFSWMLCSNHQSAELERQYQRRLTSDTHILLKRRLDALDKHQLTTCHEQMALAPLFDAWGRMVRCAEEGSVVALVSSGPDRDFNSRDDITATRPLEEEASPAATPPSDP